MSTQQLRVQLFETMSISLDGNEISLPGSSVARRLLAYLLLNDQRTHARPILAGLFWPDVSESRARRALSQAVWHIRRRFPSLLDGSNEFVAISSQLSVWKDVDAFLNLVSPYLETGMTTEPERADLERALALYRGDLLEGIYDDWVLLERERLHEFYLQTLTQLGLLEKSSGNYLKALELVQKLINANPLQEASHREAMRLYFLLRKPKAALRQFGICQQIMLDEMGLEPEVETIALVEEIARQSPEIISPYLPKSSSLRKPITLQSQQPVDITLIGRDTERDDLLQYVEGIFQNKGGIVLIEGEAGIGKTRLLREIAQDAEWRNAQPLWGQCLEYEAAMPFAPFVTAIDQGLSPLRVRQLSSVVDLLWLQVLKPLLKKVAQTLPELAPPPALKPEQERARMLEAMANFLMGWAAITPLLLILEDLHWADQDTLSLLSVLQNHLGDSRMLLVGAYRGEDARASTTVWEQMQALDRAGLRRRLVLDNLDQATTGKLIRRCLGLSEPAPVFEQRIYKETNGNPLFVLETLRTLQDEGFLVQNEDGIWQTPWDDETADYAELPLPPMVEQLIARRLDRLSQESRQILDAAVVLGFHVDFLTLTAVCDLETERLFKPIEDLITRHLWEETAEGYRFSHDKIRQVALAALDEERLRYLHARAAQAIETHAPALLDALAYHHEQAEHWDEAARFYYQAGIQAASSHAYQTARSHYHQVLKNLDRTENKTVDRFELLSALEKTLDVLGERDAQLSTLEAMQNLATEDTANLYTVTLRRAWLLTNASRFADAQDTARRALQLSKARNDKNGQAESLNVLGTSFTWQGQNEDAIAPLQEAIILAQQTGNSLAEARYRRSLASALLGVRNYDAAERELKLSLAEANKRNDVLEQAENLNLLGIIYMEHGISDAGHDAYEKSLKYSRQIGYLYGAGRALVNLGNLYYFQGKLGKMLQSYTEGSHIFALLGQKRGEVQTRLNRASISQNVLGNFAQNIKDAEYALAYGRQVGDALSEGQALTVLAEVSRRQGDMEKARSYLLKGIGKMEECGDRWLLVQEYRVLAQLDLIEHLPDQALGHLNYALNICKELNLADVEPPLKALKGLAFLQKEELDVALQCTTEALAKLKPGIEQAYLLPYWHAQVLRAMGRFAESSEAIVQSYQLLQEMLSSLSAEQRRSSLENVTEHREIVAAWQQGQPNRIVINMPKVEGGNKDVIWTVDTPDDTNIAGKVALRRHRLRRLLAEAKSQGGIPTYQHLADALNVGLRTIERDMAGIQKE
ncbi:MAG: AAA family ATPase [Anaerolineales bacterium]|nr:AAA family ATPase [Anaerolineales bacterium]